MSGANDEAGSDKWICEYCTYENFPSALKCTMCRGSKPLLNEDIFRLSPAVESSSNIIGVASGICDGQIRPSNGKWSCEACTFFNWPRAQNCVQCHTSKHKDKLIIDGSLTGNICEKNRPLTISQHSDIAQGHSETRIGSPGSKPPSIRATSQNLSRTGSPLGLRDLQQKWSCVVCTYENWPKTTKCAMCATVANLSSLITPISPSIHNINSPKRQSPSCTVTSDQLVQINQSRNNSNSIIERHANSVVSSPEREQGANWYRTISNSNIAVCPDDNATKRNVSRIQLGSNEGGTRNLSPSPNNCELERRLRQIRRQADWGWLNACLGVVEGDVNPVEAYLSTGGDPARQLTASEATLLNRSSAFDAGYTLIHLAIRFHREDMLATLLSQISGSGSGVKRVPSYVAPDLATDIRRHITGTIRQRKGSFPCNFVTEHATFALPAEIEELPGPIQEQLFEELLDKDSQQQLESAPPALNWSLEVTVRLGSRLYALWNRSAGDCLLDSAMQATWGVFDRDNTLRRALSDSLHQGGHIFYPRWKEYETLQASLMHFSLEEGQWEEDWGVLLSLASQPGSSLEQLHVFALAHILRRPIIVYGVKYVKSFRGEALGYARFQGVYLPLLWDQSFCIRSPLALGYTRGHFSALVPMEPYTRIEDQDPGQEVTFLPLMDNDRKLMPVHFLTQSEMGREESLLRQWLDVCITEGGLMVAQQRLHKRPLLVAQMLEEWLNHYRRLVQLNAAPFARAQALQGGYSSDGDSEEE